MHVKPIMIQMKFCKTTIMQTILHKSGKDIPLRDQYMFPSLLRQLSKT